VFFRLIFYASQFVWMSEVATIDLNYFKS